MTNVGWLPARRGEMVSETPWASSTDATAQRRDAIELSALLVLLWRRKWLVAFCVAGALILAKLYVSWATPLYRADALIVLEARKPEVLRFDAAASTLTTSPSGIQTEVDVLRSAALAERVIDRLELMNDPELNPFIGIEPEAFDWWGSFTSLFREDEVEARDNEPQTISMDEQKTAVIDIFKGRLLISNINESYSIWVSFTSELPAKAALTANTVVEQYLVSQLEAKLDAMHRANRWLSDRVSDLRKRVEESDFALQTYKEKMELIQTRGQNVSTQQLAELNTELVVARTDLAEASARLKRVQQLMQTSQVGSAPEVLGSPIIQSMKAQEVELIQEEADLSLRYGSRHPQLINLRGELRNLRDRIDTEIDNIARSLESEVAVARIRMNTLESSLRELQKKVGELAVAEVKLGELQRESEANHALFQEFLARFKETSNQQDVQQPDARIVSKARPPLNPYIPKKGLAYIVAALGGSVLGIILSFLIEQFDNRMRSTEQLEAVAGIPTIGITPSFTRLPGRDKVFDHMLTRPNSAYSEALNNLLAAIQFIGEAQPRSLLVTSAMPREGKTTLAVSLALAYSRAGFKTLLVDADLRRPTISKLFKLTGGPGLMDLLQARTEIAETLHPGPNGLMVLPAGALPNADPKSLERRFIAAVQLRRLLEQLGKHFDIIVLDSPPLVPVADANLMASLVDITVLVVRWSVSSKQSVRLALRHLQRSKAKIACTVLTCVNLRRHRAYGYHDQGHYYDSARAYNKG